MLSSPSSALPGAATGALLAATPTNVAPEACLHCGLPLGAGDDDGFCCAGCRSVHRLIGAEGLARYYRLRSGAGRPVAELAAQRRDLKWLEPLEAEVARADGSVRITLDVQGIHCSACVWLIEELFHRRARGVRALVNPSLGRVDLAVEHGFELGAWVRDVERFGYRFGPPLKDARASSDPLLLRAGVCVALAVNAMSFGIAMHLGLRAGPVYALLGWLNAVLATLALVVGGSIFVRSAWSSLRHGVLHLDTPIALGIVLAYGGSVGSFLWGGGRADYLDTVTVFIALMVLGRWLQERVLERNRRQLLADDGVEGLLARRVTGEGLELVPCRTLREGDELLVAPGDLLPVDAMLTRAAATFSLDWIDGESEPRPFLPGATLPAGAFNAGLEAALVIAASDFARSPLVLLLQTPAARRSDGARATGWWRRVARRWVAAILVASALGFAGWWLATGDIRRALEVATAVLVVTCPCAFGIASPLAYDLVQAGLRRAGLFVRSPGFLDRALAVRRVVLDKTGTLTTGTLEIDDRSALSAASAAERQVLYDLAARSSHPKSAALRRALESDHLSVRRELEVTEHAGAGLETVDLGRVYRMGAAAWAAPLATFGDADLVFSVDGVAKAAFRTREELRPDARTELAELARTGFETWILSGDAPERVSALAAEVGVAPARALGGLTPEGKAEWLSRHDHGDTLMVGDGINDSLVVAQAHCSGTPAVDRPFMAARSDFYFTTAGLGPLRLALRAAARLHEVLRRNLRWAVAYNVLAVALAWAGWMKPWLAAVLMPASSIAIVAATAAALSSRSSLWRC